MCVHGIGSILFNVSNVCGKIRAIIPEHRGRIYLESGQKAFKVVSDFMQLQFVIIQTRNTGPGGVAGSGKRVLLWWCHCLCLVPHCFQILG